MWRRTLRALRVLRGEFGNRRGRTGVQGFSPRRQKRLDVATDSEFRLASQRIHNVICIRNALTALRCKHTKAPPLSRMPCATMTKYSQQKLLFGLPKLSNHSRAFSLIEVTLALGIIAVALIPLIALLPMGLDSQRSAIESTATTQILQTITGDLQRSEFNELVDPTNLTATDLPIRYFDELGNEIPESELANVPAVGTGSRLYDAQVILDYPAPIGQETNYAMVRADIRIAHNPQHEDAETLFADESSDQYLKHFALIAKTSK